MNHARYILIFLGLLLSFAAYSKELYFRHLTFDEGVAKSSGISIFQDGIGRIWFGNESLNVYDGERVRSFRISDYVPGVVDNNIHMLCGDKKENLYFLANDRLLRMDMEEEKIEDLDIQARVLHCEDSVLFFTSGHRLFRYGGKEIVCELALEDTTLTIKAVLPHASGWYLGTNGGLFSLEKEGDWELLLFPENITCLFEDKSHRLWAGTQQGDVWIRQGDEWMAFQKGSSSRTVGREQIRCFNQEENGNIWIGAFSGITVIDSLLDKQYKLTYNPDIPWSLPHSSVYAICRDRQGGMWVGTYYGGLSYFNPDTERFFYYGSEPGDPSMLNGYIFGQMTEDDKGGIYIATENGGLNRIDTRTRQVKRFQPGSGGIPCSTTKSVWYDRDYDLLYIGTFLNGLLSYSPEQDTFKLIGGELLRADNQRIISYLYPWQHYLILVTQGGLYKLDRKTRKLTFLFEDSDKQRQTEVIYQAVFIDSEDRLWLTTSLGEVRYIDLDKGSFTDVTKLTAFIGHRSVKHISQDSRGNLFFTVTGMGVVQYHPGMEKIHLYSQESGHLLTDDSFEAEVLTDSLLLITSAKGITLLDLVVGKGMHTIPGNLSPLTTINGNCGVYVTAAKDIYIGGVGGIICVNMEDLVTRDYPYSLMFNFLSVNNEPVYPLCQREWLVKGVPYTTSLELPYNRNNISIGFASTNYRHSDRSLFAYKLEGMDNQWTRAAYNQVTYTALSPGRYRLLIRELNGEKQIGMDIRIRPPFYASTPAWILYALLALLFATWLIRVRRNRMVLQATLEREQQEKQKIEEINQLKQRFYVNISHELRTPLTLMTSQLDLALQSEASSSLRNKLIRIKRHTSHMQQLITEVLDLRKIEQNRMPLHAGFQNLVAFVRTIYSSFQDYAQMKRIDFSFYTTDDEIWVWYDPVQIRKAINNLLFNAFKFTPERGTITISLSKREAAVEIAIADTGCGIAPEDKEYIFDRFYQAEQLTLNATPGTGIGLALTREIVQQHKGLVSVQSEVDKGSVFTLSLPLGEGHLTAEQKTSSPPAVEISHYAGYEVGEELQEPETPEEDGKSVSVLIVEDNFELRELLKEAFSPMYTVWMAADGEEGVELAEKHLPNIIISDIVMPKLSGIEMCRRLRYKFETSHIPVILLTARTNEETALESLQSGAFDYIVKPFNIEFLLLKCKNIIRSRRELQQRFQTEVHARPVELTTNGKDQQLLEESMAIIERNLENQKFNIDSWCKEIAIGRTRLAAKIKHITGLTLNDFILQIKLRKCASLLRDKNLTISEITWMTGFSSPSYMGKCFKEHFGMTPVQYRNKEMV